MTEPNIKNYIVLTNEEQHQLRSALINAICLLDKNIKLLDSKPWTKLNSENITAQENQYQVFAKQVAEVGTSD